MAPPTVEVAQIFRRYGEAYERRYGRLQAHPRRVVRDLITCRTQQLGGHRYVCQACGGITERSGCEPGLTPDPGDDYRVALARGAEAEYLVP
jgi:hypothetical protein